MAEIYTYQPKITQSQREAAALKRRLGIGVVGQTSSDLDVKSASGLRKARLAAAREAEEQRLAEEDFKRRTAMAAALNTALAERAKVRAIAEVYLREETDWLRKMSGSGITARGIIEACCNKYNVTPLGILSRKQIIKLCHVRQIVAYLMCEMTVKSTTEIGRILGGRDHATIVHSRQKIEGKIAADPVFAAEIAELKAVLEPA